MTLIVDQVVSRIEEEALVAPNKFAVEEAEGIFNLEIAVISAVEVEETEGEKETFEEVKTKGTIKQMKLNQILII